MTPHMLTIRQTELGGPEVLRLVEVPRPAPGPTQVSVQVHAAGVNPVDAMIRRSGGFLGQPPFTVGWDVSGVVAAVAPGVTRFEVGDEVFGMPWFPLHAGGYGQYVTAPSRHFARKPSTVDHITAAGLPLAGLTAWQALVDTANVQPGQRVLVHAAAGGVGHLAVQLAKALGASVVGTASASRADFLRELGLDRLVDYRTVDFTLEVGEVDVVLDTVGADYAERSMRVLRPGGILVSITRMRDIAQLRELAATHGVRVEAVLVEPDRYALEQLADLVDKGQLRVHVGATFPLEEAPRAHEQIESGHTAGKIVLTVPQ